MYKGFALLCEPDKLFFHLTVPQAAWTTRDSPFSWGRPGDATWSSSRYSSGHQSLSFCLKNNLFKIPEWEADMKVFYCCLCIFFSYLLIVFSAFLCSSRARRIKIKEAEESYRNQEYCPLVFILCLILYWERKNPREHTCCCQANLYFIAQKQLPGQTAYPAMHFFSLVSIMVIIWKSEK